jgi:hypothetical protein
VLCDEFPEMPGQGFQVVAEQHAVVFRRDAQNLRIKHPDMETQPPVQF